MKILHEPERAAALPAGGSEHNGPAGVTRGSTLQKQSMSSIRNSRIVGPSHEPTGGARSPLRAANVEKQGLLSKPLNLEDPTIRKEYHQWQTEWFDVI